MRTISFIFIFAVFMLSAAAGAAQPRVFNDCIIFIPIDSRPITNMYTAPEYRRQGIAIHTLDLLVKDAKEQGVLQIALEATDMGRPLYERYGFVKMEDEMELKE